MNNIAVIGSGNIVFKDEGAGLYAAVYLRENYDFSSPVEFIDGGTLGFGLMPVLQEFDTVFVLNAASEGAQPPGHITVRERDAFLGGPALRKTANEAEIAEMLQVCSLTGKVADTTVVSIAPEDILSVEIGLSSSLMVAWPVYIETVLRLLASAGISCKKHAGGPALEMILQTFSDPGTGVKRGG